MTSNLQRLPYLSGPLNAIAESSELKDKIAIRPIKKLTDNTAAPNTSAVASLVIAPKAKKTRRATTKSRGGCATCKGRRKKCDETKPTCIRCTQGGWTCSYPSHLVHISLSPNPKETLFLSPTLLFSNNDDALCLQYMWESFKSNPEYPFEYPVWSLVLQMCSIEPCIRHITLGTAKIHSILRTIVENPSDPSQIETYRSAFNHYNRSVQLLNSRLAELKGKASHDVWEVSLVSNILYTIFELLVGNESGAYWHMQSGFNLVKSMLHEYKLRTILPGHLEEITDAYNQVDIQASTSSHWYETNSLRPPKVADMFYTLTDAKVALESILPGILSIARHGPETCSWTVVPRSIPENPLRARLHAELDDLKILLQRWLATLNKLLCSQNEDLRKTPVGIGSTKFRIGHHILMIQYWAAFIWLHTPFTLSQMVYDAYLPTFLTITELAEEILRLQPERKNIFLIETGFIHLLFYVAQRCRDGGVRRRAIAAMKCSGREGVWDGQSTAAACEWIVSQEEKSLPDGVIGSLDPNDPAFVEEKYRLRGANIGMNRLGKMVKIECKRMGEDGVDENVQGFVAWGDGGGAEVLYGEAEKLWQDLSLFG